MSESRSDWATAIYAFVLIMIAAAIGAIMIVQHLTDAPSTVWRLMALVLVIAGVLVCDAMLARRPGRAPAVSRRTRWLAVAMAALIAAVVVAVGFLTSQ